MVSLLALGAVLFRQTWKKPLTNRVPTHLQPHWVGLPPTFPDVTFNPSVMQSNTAFVAQAQGSNSRRQCAGHDHLHRSGRRHGNEAIQSEEGAQFPRQWGPNRHKRQREPVDPDSAIQRTFPCNKVGSSDVAVGATHPGFLEADMQARSQVQMKPPARGS